MDYKCNNLNCGIMTMRNKLTLEEKTTFVLY